MATLKFSALEGAPRNVVAESPIWDADAGLLYWVDIVGKSIFRYDVGRGQSRAWPTADFPTAIALRQGRGDAIVALAAGVEFFDFDKSAFSPFCVPDETPGNRLNEGRCDPAGRLWVGSMQTNLNPDGSGRDMDRHSGALFRIDPDGTASRHTAFEFGISNTMAWAPDGKIFYFGDSLRNVIFAFDYDADDGTLSNRRVLIEGYAHGVPDGSAIDEDGCLWNARFGAGRIIRITPGGRVDRNIELPVTNPTSCTFGGPNRETLFVTSAKFTLSEAQLLANPMEGAVLAARVGTRGLPDHVFAG